jgi:hypothetical protein
MKYTISDKRGSLDLEAESPEEAAQQWADQYDWSGYMVAFNRATVQLGDTVLGEFTHGRFDLVHYIPYLTARWDEHLGRYEVPCEDSLHRVQTYLSADGSNWEVVDHEGARCILSAEDDALLSDLRIQLLGGPRDGALLFRWGG